MLAVNEPRHVQGTSGKGKAYDFHSVSFEIWTGKKGVECTVRKDRREDLPEIPVGVRLKARVVSARPRDGAMAFDVEV